MRRVDLKNIIAAGLFIIIATVSAAQPSGQLKKQAEFPKLFLLSPLQSVNQPGVPNNETAALYVYVFLSPECPLCIHYVPVLKELQQRYAGKIIIRGIVPGQAYTPDTLKQFCSEYQINFPLYIDSAKTLTNYLSARVTPEAMVFTMNQKRIYRGAIDDWMNELGQARIKAGKFYLQDAIISGCNRQPVAIRETVAKGCLINDF
ncbi:MAG TPA: hypothetical protein VFS36_01440 [Chitinophagaceae bacterium]|jgi:thiol-disulfide isomerase/thioredoxin|nr:hypothetical protein [Chitinophagaceae bacterium]